MSLSSLALHQQKNKTEQSKVMLAALRGFDKANILMFRRYANVYHVHYLFLAVSLHLLKGM